MVMVHPEILNIELVSLSYFINVLCYRFNGIGIRIELFHVLFHFLLLLIGRESGKVSLMLFNFQILLLSCELVIIQLMLFTKRFFLLDRG